jgi:hypothetical protein
MSRRHHDEDNPVLRRQTSDAMDDARCAYVETTLGIVDHRFDGIIGELTLPTGVVYVFKPRVDQHLAWILFHRFTP